GQGPHLQDADSPKHQAGRVPQLRPVDLRLCPRLQRRGRLQGARKGSARRESDGPGGPSRDRRPRTGHRRQQGARVGRGNRSAGVTKNLGRRRAKNVVRRQNMHVTMTSTAFGIDGYRTTKTLGLVRGISVRSRSIFGTIGGSLQTLFGGNISLFTNLCEKTRG